MHSGDTDVINGWIDTQTAASLAGYHVKHVRKLIRQGRIDARKVARDWLVNRDSLMAYKQNVKPGRPRKGT